MRGGSVRHRRRQDAATPAPEAAILDDFLTQADTWLWATDARHQLTLLTPSFEARTGMVAAGLLGRPLGEVVGVDPLGAAGGLEAVLGAGTAFADLAAWLGSEAGGARAVVLSGWPVLDGRGRFAGYRGTGRARSATESGDGARALRDLLRVLSHELSAPLGTVLGMSELLQGGDLAAEQRRYAAAINGAGIDLLAIANELLDLARAQSGEAAVEAIDFDLAALVDGQVMQCAARARQKALTVRATFAAGLPPRLVGDPWRLRQIIAQILGSAIATTAAGAVTLAVAPLPATGGRPWIRFEAGGGDAPATPLPQLFQAPGRAGRHPVAAATGGLALCARLVASLGGRMGHPGGAAAQPIWIELPFTAEGHRRVTQPLADRGILAGLPVVLIEGSPVDRQVMAELLRRAGARIETADTLEEAVASPGGPVAVIALDARLTRGRWRDARRRLAMHPRFADAVLALLDPRGAHGHGHRARAAGFAAYLAKPVRPAILVRAVAALADRQRRMAAGDGDRVLITRHVLREWARSGGEPLEPSGPPDHSDAISREVLEPVRAALGGAGLCDLVQHFGEDARDRLERIRAAAAAGETATVVQTLYDLRSTTGSIGATNVFAAAEALLKRCRGGAPVDLEGPLLELQDLLGEAVAALDAYAREGAQG